MKSDFTCEARLVWATEKTVARLLASIDLCVHGVPYPFYPRTTKYSVIVQPDLHRTRASRRVSYESVIADARVSIAASAAEAAAALAAGLLPF